MPEELTTEDRLEQLRELIASARSMPMSASCVVNRAEADRIIAEAHQHALDQAGRSSQVKVAEEQAAKIIAEAQSEAEALKREVDVFIDSRMASFESVLAKTSSQVRTARRRLAERNGEEVEEERRPRATELPSLD